MKKRLLTFLTSASITYAFGQGTIDFQNINVNVPVYKSDGITGLSGSQFLAELFAGPSATNLAAIATTSFLTGKPGYFFGGVQTVNTLFGGSTAWVQVDVWNTGSGVSFDQAQTSGLPNSWWQSDIFTVILGRGGVNPTPPAPLVGLGNGPVFLNGVVPEPSTLVLGLVGASVFLLWRRRNLASRPLFIKAPRREAVSVNHNLRKGVGSQYR